MSEEQKTGTASDEPQIARVPVKREVRVVHDVVPLLDTDRFDHMKRVATVMATMTLIPDGLKADSHEATAANCFLVVNFAASNEMDPFQVAQMVSVIHGKLCFEGKLIHALIEKKLGVRLDYEMTGEKGTEKRGVIVSGKFADEEKARTIDGDVAEWKVVNQKKGGGETSAWYPKSYDRMLRYRGAREWCRAYAPGVLLGVYSRDEMEEIEYEEMENRPPEAPRDIPIGAPASGPVPDAGRQTADAQPAEAPPTEGDDLEMPECLRRAGKPSREAEDAEVIDDTPPGAPDDEPPGAPEEPEQPAPSPDSILDALEVDLLAAKTPAEVTAAHEGYKPAIAGLLKPDQEEASRMVAQALGRLAKK